MAGPTMNPVVHTIAMLFLLACWAFGWVLIVWGVSQPSNKFLVQGIVVVAGIGYTLVQGWRRRPTR